MRATQTHARTAEEPRLEILGQLSLINDRNILG